MSANSISGERGSQISNLYVLSCAYEALVTRIHQPFVSAESPVPRLSDQVFRFDLSLQTRPNAPSLPDRRAASVHHPRPARLGGLGHHAVEIPTGGCAKCFAGRAVVRGAAQTPRIGTVAPDAVAESFCPQTCG